MEVREAKSSSREATATAAFSQTYEKEYMSTQAKVSF
jgi:hypothetical protein